MDDLNDLQLFVSVVEHRGFNAAARALDIPKSRLSRRIVLLEQRIGLRLLQRSSRGIILTEAGAQFNERCRAVVELAASAYDATKQRVDDPEGSLRLSCPVTLAQLWLVPLLPAFMKRYPRVRVALNVSHRRVNPQEEHIDVAFRVRQPPFEDSSLVTRTLGKSKDVLVASPDLLAELGDVRMPGELHGYPTLAVPGQREHHTWTLHCAEERAVVAHRPRMLADDLLALKQAAEDGIGIAALPLRVCESEIANGTLKHVLPDWHFSENEIQAVFASRRGMPPAMRALLDFLALHPPEESRGRHRFSPGE